MMPSMCAAPLYRRTVSAIAAVAAVLTLSAAAGAAELDIRPDVIYGHKDGMALTLDVIKPKGNANGAAIIYMVSGGWVSRWVPAEQTAQRFGYLLGHGFSLIAVRHGSSPKYFVPEAVDDVRRAVRFIRYHAKEWGLDPNRLGIHGGSAGGHLSLAIATASDDGDPNAEEPFMREGLRIASVVAFYPPVDLQQWARGPIPVTPDQRFPALNFAREKAAAISPILFVTPDDPPTLLIHGDADRTVPISHSQRMFQALQDKSVPSKFITLPGAGHGFRGADLEKAQALTLEWFQQTLLGKN